MNFEEGELRQLEKASNMMISNLRLLNIGSPNYSGSRQAIIKATDTMNGLGAFFLGACLMVALSEVVEKSEFARIQNMIDSDMNYR